MTGKRLRDLYQAGDVVEITFDGKLWLAAVVLTHDPPGMWVQTVSGNAWFVTNIRHVRWPERES